VALVNNYESWRDEPGPDFVNRVGWIGALHIVALDICDRPTLHPSAFRIGRFGDRSLTAAATSAEHELIITPLRSA
jgi:hypothetical protein